MNIAVLILFPGWYVTTNVKLDCPLGEIAPDRSFDWFFDLLIDLVFQILFLISSSFFAYYYQTREFNVMTPQQHNCSVNKHIIELIVRIYDQKQVLHGRTQNPAYFLSRTQNALFRVTEYVLSLCREENCAKRRNDFLNTNTQPWWLPLMSHNVCHNQHKISLPRNTLF